MPSPPLPAVPPVGRVAIVHDWLTGMRGGERVLENLCELFPQARIHTLVHVPGTVSSLIEQRRPRNALIGYLPLAARYYRQYLPLFPFAIEQVDVDDCDLVISSSHCAAKAVVRPGRARHLCYCHSPMRYAWDQFDVYFGPARLGGVGSAALRPVLAALARWDAATARRVDRFLANSQHVAARIHRYYNREATVVYPPVDTDYFRPSGSSPNSYFLIVSALVPYKRLEVAIRACDAAGIPLKVVGTGPELARLTRIAGPRTEFLGWLGVEELRSLYQHARACLQPGEEDFGMAPVEAQACGCPVVALARGGALESVDDGVTGVLVPEPTVEAFLEGFRRLAQGRFDATAIRARALRFSRDRFAAGISHAVNALFASDCPW